MDGDHPRPQGALDGVRVGERESRWRLLHGGKADRRQFGVGCPQGSSIPVQRGQVQTLPEGWLVKRRPDCGRFMCGKFGTKLVLEGLLVFWTALQRILRGAEKP